MEQAPIIQLVQLPKGYFKFEQIAYYGTPPEEIFAVTLAAFETAFEVSIKEEEYETDGYYLTVANQELAQKLEPGKEHLMGEGFGEESLIPPVSMKQLAGYLQRQLNSVVLDRTELAGAFMLKIQLNEKGPRNLKKFNDALTEFGLKLEPFSSPEKVKAVVIRSTKE